MALKKPPVSINDIKNNVVKYQGQRVQLEAHKSKKKLYRKTGYIEKVYPSIFTIVLDNDQGRRQQHRMSFSYIDLLTKNVKIEVVDPDTGELIAL